MRLHPEKIVPKGWFTGENTFGAKLFRVEATTIGVFAVFCGTASALSTVLQPLMSAHTSLQFVMWLLATAAGVLAVIYFRNEVRRRPRYEGTSLTAGGPKLDVGAPLLQIGAGVLLTLGVGTCRLPR